MSNTIQDNDFGTLLHHFEVFAQMHFGVLNTDTCRLHAKPLYSNIENLVFWARSEKIGYALNQCHGTMEYWNAGILGLVQ